MPAAGYRSYATGALRNVGTVGDYWPSSPQSGSANAGNLYFTSSNMNPLTSAARANAFPVRCVQHLRLFFILIPT